MKSRYILLPLLAATALVSCSRIEPVGVSTACDRVEIIATCEGSRTANDGMSTIWADGDALSVFAGTAYGKFDYQGGQCFTGELPASHGNDWYAVYPYSSANSSASAVSISIPTAQAQAGNGSTAHLAGPGFPLCGSAKGVASNSVPELTMKQVASVARFVITNGEAEPLIISSIEFTAPSAIAGNFNADLTDENAVWTASQDASSSKVTLTVTNSEAILNGKSAEFSVGLMPFSSTNGEFTLTVSGKSNGIDVVSEKAFTKSMVFTAGKINTLNYKFKRTEDKQASTPGYYEKVTSEPTSWEGTYIIVESGNQYAFTPLSTAKSPYRAGVTVSGNKVQSTPEVDSYAVTINKVGKKHTNNSSYDAYNIVNSEGKTLICSSNTVIINSSSTYNSTQYAHTLYYNNGVQVMSSRMSNGATKYYLRYSSNSFSYNSTSSNRVQLYKLVGNQSQGQTAPQNQEVYNLESKNLTAYLNEAEASYSDTDWSTNSVVAKYKGSGEGYDVPSPVSLSWLGYPDATKTVSVYNDEACTKLETSVSTADSKAAIYNLIPGETFWYKVTTETGDLVASGTFRTEGRRRQMRISTNIGNDYANNCRDLGGLKTVDGSTLQFKKVYRGSNMSKTSSDEKAYILGYMNVGADIDLRNGYSSTNSQSAYPAFGSSITYSNAGFGSWNDLMNGEKIKTTFTDIINTLSSGKAVYIHCYVGADRTGYICMLLEAVCGVSQKDCSIDYEITTLSCVGIRDRNSKQSRIYFHEGMPYIQNYTKGSTFQEKAEHILLDAGITADQITALRAAMIE